MSIVWKSCRQCPFYHVPSSECYHIIEENHVDDPDSLPSWCPQLPENPGRFGTGRQFPYIEEKCEGCRADSSISCLGPCCCTNHVCRPMTETCGECPMKGLIFHLPKMDFGKDAGPVVSSRVAELIRRGVVDGDMSYWEIDSQSYGYAIGWGVYQAEVHGFSLKRNKDGTFEAHHYRWYGKRYIRTICCTVDHAEIQDGILYLYAGKSRYLCSCCIAVKIHDAELQPEPEVEEEDECECETTVDEKPAPKTKSITLEAWV